MNFHDTLQMEKGFRESGCWGKCMGRLSRVGAHAPGIHWLPAANQLAPTSPQALGTGPAPQQTALNWMNQPLG